MASSVVLRPLTGTWFRILAVAVAAGVVSGALLWLIVAIGAARPDPGPIHEGGWVNRSRAWFSHRGFYATEFYEDGQHPHNWTGGSIRLQVPNLNRSRPYRLEFDIEAPRATVTDPVLLAWTIDGTQAGDRLVVANRDTLAIVLPPSTRTRAVLTMTISPTFTPGPGDDRQLGVAVHSIAIVPEQGGWRPTWSVTAQLGSAVACVVMGVLLCGLPGRWWIVAAGAVPAAFVWLVVQDGAFLGDYPRSLLNIGAATAAIGAGVAILRAFRSGNAGAPGWATAIGMVLGISIVKLAVFTHPQATIGDGIFQVHRSALVQQGVYFFTSVTPRPFFEFPYAIALFVAAIPFWDQFTRDVDHVWLLRTLSLAADALVGVAMYAVASRLWANPRVALMAAGLWPFARAPVEALCNSNLPNVFGQGVFGVAMAGLIWSLATRRPAALAFGLSTLALAVAFLSHFSTFTTGVAIVGAVALALMLGGSGTGRRQGALMMAAGALAILLAYAVYYRHFGEVYQATVDRVMSEEVVEQPGSAIAATPAVKFRRWISGTSDDYGLPGTPLALAAAAGVFLLVRERRRDALTLSLMAWLLIWAGFSALGILTAVQMRVNLATAPVFVCLGAYALGTSFAGGRVFRWIAVAVVAAVVWSGVSLWLMCLGR
jgi:hypothetical protein